jgi:excisionase family DNA binding protein
MPAVVSSAAAPPHPSPSQPARRMLKTREAADYLGIGLDMLRELIEAGKIPYVKFRESARRFDVRDLDAYIEGNKSIA